MYCGGLYTLLSVIAFEAGWTFLGQCDPFMKSKLYQFCRFLQISTCAHSQIEYIFFFVSNW